MTVENELKAETELFYAQYQPNYQREQSLSKR